VNKTIEFTDLKPLLDELNGMITSGNRYVYRGYNIEEELYPSVIRGTDFSDYEEELLVRYERYALAYGNVTNQTDFMLSAQHYGLPTRLLDFTYNPFVALFFATFKLKIVSDNDDSNYYSLRYADMNNCICATLLHHVPTLAQLDGTAACTFAIRAYQGFKQLENLMKGQQDKKLILLDPNQTDSRILMQQGLFMLPYTLDKGEHLKIVKNNTTLIKIHKDLRNGIRAYLDKLGYNTYRLMPDLASVCFAVKNDVEQTIQMRSVKVNG